MNRAASLVVVDAGALTTVQDRGRVGHAHLGVPRAGALDGPAADLANRLVGNAAGAALLETTLTGCLVRVAGSVTVAVTGALCVPRLDGRAVAFGEPVDVPTGSVVEVGRAVGGVRSYLAVSGGIDVAPVLGSRSTDTLAWLGPERLAPGAVLPVGRVRGRPAPVDAAWPSRRASELRLLPGPRQDWVDPRAWRWLDGATYRVGADSNRVGLRLEGPVVGRVRDTELPSEGIVCGAVQLPPSGQPVVFLHDHPTTGGYPVIAVVARDDLPGCAQLAPGDEVALLLTRW